MLELDVVLELEELLELEVDDRVELDVELDGVVVEELALDAVVEDVTELELEGIVEEVVVMDVEEVALDGEVVDVALKLVELDIDAEGVLEPPELEGLDDEVPVGLDDAFDEPPTDVVEDPSGVVSPEP